MKKKMLFGSLGILMGISIVFYSCSNTNNPVATTGGSGIMKINMIDASANFDTVNITIDSVQAHISTANDNSGWITLNNFQSKYDLAQLVNGNSAVIAKDSLPAGNYSQIRLYLGTGYMDNYVVLHNQTQQIALTTPSGTQSGIKLNVDANIQAGIIYELTVDFDVAKSIVTTGSPTNPKYILKPVIRVVTTATGIISGVVLPDTVSAEVWAASPKDSISTSTDASGAFQIFGLSPDTYKVYIFPLAPNDTAYNNMIIPDVVITAGSTTDLGNINLSEAGSISGTVSPDTASATITATLTTDGTKMYSTNIDETSGGVFKLYLPPGTYDVDITPFDDTKYKKTFTSVDVTAGTTNDLNGGAVIDLTTQ